MHSELENLAATDLDDLADLEISELRSKRSNCEDAETDISFVRRLTQGRLDIVGHEVGRRSGESNGGAIDGVLFEIPAILSDSQNSSRSNGHALRIDEPSQSALDLAAKLDQIVSPSQLSNLGSLLETDLGNLVNQLQSFEQELSTMRSNLHEAIDRLQAEIVRRYRDGEASVDTLLQ